MLSRKTTGTLSSLFNFFFRQKLPRYSYSFGTAQIMTNGDDDVFLY